MHRNLALAVVARGGGGRVARTHGVCSPRHAASWTRLQEMRDYSLNVPTIIAGLALATLPIVTFYIFGQRFFVRGLVAGALKGE